MTPTVLPPTALAARVLPSGVPGVRELIDRGVQQLMPQELDPDAAPGDPGLFGPDSATWALIGEPAHALAGLRAALLQALSLPVVVGVHVHGSFYTDFLGRVRRTASYVQAQSLGSMPEVVASARKVRARHRPVRGVSTKGLPYDAGDPHLQAWVSMTLTDSMLRIHDWYGLGRIPDELADRFVAEQAIPGALLDPRVDLDAIVDDPGQLAALQAGELPLPMIKEGELPTTRAQLDALMTSWQAELVVDNLSRPLIDLTVRPELPPHVLAGVRPLILATLRTLDDPFHQLIAPDSSRAAEEVAARAMQVTFAGLRALHGPVQSVRAAQRRVAAQEPSA